MRAGLLVAILTLPTLALSGCMDSGPAPQESCEEATDWEEGKARVKIFIERPSEAREFGFIAMWVEPRLVAWVGQNDTDDFLGLSVNKRLDWTRTTQLWYDEQIPAGNYSVVRFEIANNGVLSAQRATGEEPNVTVKFGRLSYTTADPAEGFSFEANRCYTVVFCAFLDLVAIGHWEIEGVLCPRFAQR